MAAEDFPGTFVKVALSAALVLMLGGAAFSVVLDSSLIFTGCFLTAMACWAAGFIKLIWSIK